jgi:DNA polymerase-3 subunit epsilon
MDSTQSIAVIDFETTGMTPAQGARATEVAIVRMEGGQVVDRFQSLMKTGVYIPRFITQLTGITNTMVAAAPDAREVMREAARFVGDTPMVAHNAAFDSKFWLSELAHAGLDAPQPFACTVLLSRRLYPQAPSHKLGALVDYHHLPRTGRAHRALADAEMAAALLVQIQHDLRHRWGVVQPDHALLMALQRCGKQAMGRLIERWVRTQSSQGELDLKMVTEDATD